jgi:hypothetical protein
MGLRSLNPIKSVGLRTRYRDFAVFGFNSQLVHGAVEGRSKK